MKKFMSLMVVIAMVLSMIPVVITAEAGLVVAFDTKDLTIQGEKELAGTLWLATEKDCRVRWNQNWTKDGKWDTGISGDYSLMFFASTAPGTADCTAQANFMNSAEMLKSENIVISFEFACQEKDNLYQRWNFKDNDNNVFATIYFDVNEKVSVGLKEKDVVTGKHKAYEIRGQKFVVEAKKDADGKYTVTYKLNGKEVYSEKVDNVNGFKGIEAQIPMHNDQWAAAALVNLNISYVKNDAVSQEEIDEYNLLNTPPTMNVKGGSQDYLVDTFEPITITHPATGATIYYTLDGSDPTVKSVKYEGPFHCGGDAHVKARAIAPNGKQSEMVEAWVYNRPWAATAAEFRIDGENTVNNVKIAWPLYPNATKYEVYRDGNLIGTTIGDAVDEYNLPVNVNVKYTVKAYNGDTQIAEGTTNTVTTFAIDVTETTGYDDNRRAGWVPTDENGDDALAEPRPSGYHINGKYYSVRNVGVSRELFESLGLDPAIWDKGCSCVAFEYKESEDGFKWPDEWTPIYPIFIDLRFEGKQVGMHHNGEAIIWSAHAEGTHGYSVAKLFFASFKPGRAAEEVKPYAITVSGNVILPQDQPWEQYENYGDKAGSNQFSSFYIGRPFGYDSRDMVRFTEGDTMYTFSSTRMNQDKLVIKLDEEWTKPVEVTNVILKGQRREAPAVFKMDDRYYIYTSIANGWFASQAKYSSATEIDGVWSPGRPVANAATFASQANGVWGYGSEAGRFVQRGHGYNWGHSGGWRKSNYQIFYHMAVNDGIATGNWCYKMEYHPYWGAIAVQSGETVSLGKKAYIDGKLCPNLTDNVQLERTGVTEVGHLPYQIIVDLEVPTVVREVNLTNDIYNGSNCASYFKVYGSNDENNWELLADATSKEDDDPSFRSTWITSDKAFRYIKVDVLEVNNIQQQNQSALWGGKPLEVAIYGKPEGWVAENYDLSKQEDILVGYTQNNIDFTPYGQKPVIVNDRTLVPLRAIFEAMGAEVVWDDAAKTVKATREDTTISLAIGSDQLYVNGEAVTIDVPAQIINDRTMIPVRAIAESFGC
ncbi:MAG: chitobiase/beta-hexosaminidase C-terminal domain-containing protein, partial [Clostridia bacterium]|nr:chitobiase/beta-hexosaminidase C-terminal domain-containing protein [Clostridia bacterium]